VLPAGAAIPTPRELAQEWKAAHQAKAAPALVVQRPMPDRPVAEK
jgi:hypothetical protein